ncbi:BolA family transcriptional regulator [Advenella sp. WQ 585]|uniref:BolA family transcriptional regulator n=1 Tax=Advenella mandrilli TaxID=2800330 RepID=A0ABS1EFU3_9BURK|nr:BolA family protein [Advenella mandrilli]MBK1780955.1 BolA family transcriptional regulator [Advenella mandrilli]
MSDRIKLIEERLSALSPLKLEIIDDSHLHAGHAGSKNGAGHYTVIIQSALFNGLNRVAQQRLVYDVLNDLIPFPIHALAIQTQTTI